MFDQMVLSGVGRREPRLSKFFLGSSIAYLLFVGCPLAVSIYISDPKLISTGSSDSKRPFFFLPAPGGAPSTASARPANSTRPNLYAQRRLEDIVRDAGRPQPPLVRMIGVSPDQRAAGGGGTGGDGSNPFSNGIGSGSSSVEPPPLPQEPRKPSQTTENQHPRNNAPLAVSQPVLQGKAIFRKTPEYPAIARIIKKEGSVVVEVVISPEGRVESARAVSGDPLLAHPAVAAALEWRFQPTYLGSVPVRVAGAITFIFRLAS